MEMSLLSLALQKNRSFQNDNSGGFVTGAIKLSFWEPASAGIANQVTESVT